MRSSSRRVLHPRIATERVHLRRVWQQLPGYHGYLPAPPWANAAPQPHPDGRPDRPGAVSLRHDAAGVHAFTHSLTHTFTHSHVHSLTRSLAHTFTRSHIHSLTRSLTHTFTHSHSLTHTFTHSHFHSLTFTQSHIHSHTFTLTLHGYKTTETEKGFFG